jgi:cell division protein ZapA
MAALTLADALAETGQRIKRLEDEVATLQAARANSADHAKNAQGAVAAALNAAAERLELITRKLNGSITTGNGVAMG